jgi:hypothetical protein
MSEVTTSQRTVRGGSAAAGAAAEWLCLAAAPAFAIMALLVGVLDGGLTVMHCAMMPGASALGGMVPMYLLMSAFHAGPWLKLISRWRTHRRRF